MTETGPAWSVIIPQAEALAWTVQCVSALHRWEADLLCGRGEIVVVDTGSSAISRQLSKRWLGDGVRWVPLENSAASHELLLSPAQLTAGWNRGAEVARGDRLVFLNNDVLIGGPFVRALCDGLAEPGVGMAGVEWRCERGLPAPFAPLALCQRWLAGWCFAVERQASADVPLFDPTLALYWSDTDLQWRMRFGERRSLVMVGGLPLQHVGHQTTRTLASRGSQWQVDRARFLAKWGPLVGLPPAVAETPSTSALPSPLECGDARGSRGERDSP